MHPAGIIVSPVTLPDNYGTFWAKDGKRILSINMDEIHEVSLFGIVYPQKQPYKYTL